MTTPLVSLKSIYKSYGDDILFQDLSLEVKPGEKKGVIGMNGSGKSTLLKIIARIEAPDDGQILCGKTMRSAYLPQTDKLDPDMSIEEILYQGLESMEMDEKERHRIVQRSMGKGNFENPEVKAGTLSGGWKKRLAILRAMNGNPDLLLLDEPTNHLDISGIIWLEDLLKTYRFSYMVVSHDRRFLDNVCDTVMEIGRQYPDGYFSIEGGYTEFIKEREKYLAARQKLEGSLSSKMRREDEWLHQGAKARTTKAKYRIEQAEKLRQELDDVKQQNRRTDTVDIDFHGTGRQTKKLLKARNLSKSIDNRLLFKGLSFDLSPGVRLGVVGENGSGKSTFLSVLEKTIPPDTGTVKWAENLKIAVFDQNRSRLDPEDTLRQALNPEGGDAVHFKDREVHIVTWAKRFLFMPDQLSMPVRQLSGGEKARVLIANLMRHPCDILFLDEPTNDLDILSLEVLEDSLSRFPGAIVIVSHDRYLVENLTCNLLYLDFEKGAMFFKNFDQILEFQKSIKPSTRNKESKPAPATEKKTKPVKFSFKDQYELDHIEEKILEEEDMLAGFQKKIQDPDIIKDPELMADFCSKLSRTEAQIEKLYARWEELEAKKREA